MKNLFSTGFIGNLRLPLEENKETGWQPHHIFRDSTPCVDKMNVHYSILSSGITPHEPHEHEEEELLIMLSGKADIIMVEDGSVTRKKLTTGSLVYYPAFYTHTISNISGEPATYLMFKWNSKRKSVRNDQLTASVYNFANEIFETQSRKKNGFIPRLVFDGATGYLNKLHCHFTTLYPGAGYEPHIDGYDVGIILLKGSVETLGQRAEAFSFIYYKAGTPHGIKNIGETEAYYLVFEFHGKSNKYSLLLNNGLNLILKFVRLPRKVYEFFKS